jgi:hypothetical protein
LAVKCADADAELRGLLLAGGEAIAIQCEDLRLSVCMLR